MAGVNPQTPVSKPAPSRTSPPFDSPSSPSSAQKPAAFDDEDEDSAVATRHGADVAKAAAGDAALDRISWEHSGATNEDVAALAATLLPPKKKKKQPATNTTIRTINLAGNPEVTKIAPLREALEGSGCGVVAVYLAGTGVNALQVAAVHRLCVKNALRLVRLLLHKPSL